MQPPSSAALPQAPAGSRVYAIGDIHGRLDLLDRLLGLISEDVKNHSAQRLVVIFLGDYVDRGPQSRGVIERLMGGPPSTSPLAQAEWICLRGNHEDVMLRFLSEAGVGSGWCAYGGLETIRSYAGTLPDGAVGDMQALQLLLSRALPPTHLRFLSRLPLSHEEGDYLFVHAGIRPGIPIAEQSPHDMIWIRDDFLFDTRPHEKVVVHGHTISPTPELRPNRIGIDTGAYGSEHLTAVVLEGSDQRFLVT